MTDAAWIGVDTGKLAHHATAVDGSGTVLWSRRVSNDQTEIEQLIVRARRTAAEVRWAVDLTSAGAALLLALLVVAQQKVVYVPGTVANRMADAFGGEGKTDAKDAKTIAETARLRRDLTELSTPDELVVELSLLVGHRADLMADWVRGVNRLRDLLTRVCPALERALDYSTRSALILVAGYCTPSAIRTAGRQGLHDWLTAATPKRRSSRACPAWARSSAPSSSPSPPATSPPSAPRHGWPPTPAWHRYPTTPAAAPAYGTDPAATTAGCATSSTWPRSLA
jgi:transposase